MGSPERNEADTCASNSADGVALSRSMSCKSHPKAKCASSCCAKRCLVQSNESNVEVGMSRAEHLHVCAPRMFYTSCPTSEGKACSARPCTSHLVQAQQTGPRCLL